MIALGGKCKTKGEGGKQRDMCCGFLVCSSRVHFVVVVVPLEWNGQMTVTVRLAELNVKFVAWWVSIAHPTHNTTHTIRFGICVCRVY